MTGSPEPAEAERIRFPEVDGLKGIAAVAVLAYQTLRFAAGTAGAPPAVLRAVADASQGFTLFLILAGFAFAYPLLAAMRAEGRATLDLGRYLSRRAVRVYPAYLATVVIATALHPLGQLFGYPALAHAVPGVDVPAFLRRAFLAGDGSANDGWRAVQLFALAYVALPLLLALWTRLPRALLFVAIAGALVDTLTAAHGFGAGILVPLTLGIVAAELRVSGHRSQRFGLALTAVAAAFAIVFEPRIALLPGA
ncbi:MAG: hypothetical protein IAI48_02540, partial [Candidatus Eremiobacteraeota bacterium]|nr:hypothetical protein [Candidatus Eremiobacteraeota bacterium]